MESVIDPALLVPDRFNCPSDSLVFFVDDRKNRPEINEVDMKKQMTWERRETSNLRHYCVVGERLLDDRDDGWFVSSWSDSVPIIGYWVEGGRFYQADTDWVTGTTMDLEINREIALDPERERITLEAIDGWKNHSEECTRGHDTAEKPGYHLVAA